MVSYLSEFGRRFPPRGSLAAAPLSILLATVAPGAAEAKRLALIVGNSEYDNVYSLNNATNDARDVAQALERLDFEVTLLTDSDKGTFETKLEDFAAKAEDAESTLFFFSGHAFQLDGVNYLVPSDAALTSADAIKTQTWRLDDIIGKLEDLNRQTLIFLDACRNNPLPESQRGNTGEGLAKLETGSGTFVAFATQPNNVTSDGSGDNSPFTQALLSHVETPGISISDMMINVRNDVEADTYGKQTPWDQSSLRAQFYFKPQNETVAQLTDADLDMISQLDPETARRLLAALGASGVETGFEILDVEDVEEEGVEVASAGPAYQILDVEDGDTDGGPGLDLLEVENVPTTGGTAVGATGGTSVGATDAATVAANSAAPTVRVARPAESSAVQIPSATGTVRVAGAESTGAAGAETAQTSGATQIATATGGAGEAVTAAGTTDTAGNVAITAVLPADPNADDSGSVIDDNALVLAALAPSRALEPISLDRSRVIGQEITPEGAKEAGLELPTTELQGRELARAVQTELSRVGCYRAKVDGAFGKLSAVALTRYYIAKRTAVDKLEPTNALLQILRTEDGVVCEGVVAPPKPTRVASKPRTTIVKKEPTKAVAKSGGKKKIQRSVTTTTTASGKTKKKTIKRINTGVFR